MRLTSENLVEAETNKGSRVSHASLAELRDLMATRRMIERECLAAAIAHGDTNWEAEIVASMHLLSRTKLPTSAEDRAAAGAWSCSTAAFISR